MTESESIRIGRANDSDLRVTDFTVSRNHAILYIQKGDFYIKDLMSKFGTHVQLQNEILVLPNSPIAIISGKIQIIFSIARNCFSFLKRFPYFKCNKNKKIISLDLDYNEYLKDKVPIYYKQELEKVNVLDTNYSLDSNDLRSSKKTQSNKEILCYDNNRIEVDNSEVNLKNSRLSQNDYSDMTTNRVDDSQRNSIIEGRSRSIVDESQTIENVTQNYKNKFQSSIFQLLPNSSTYRSEDRENLDLLSNYTRGDIVNSESRRSIKKIRQMNNKNEKKFNSEKNVKKISDNESLKVSNEKKKFMANSYKSKDLKKMADLKGENILDFSVFSDDILSESDYKIIKENIPYVNNFDQTGKEGSKSKYKILDLKSNSVKKEMERLDTFNPNAFKKFESKKSNKTKSCQVENYIPVSELDVNNNLKISDFNIDPKKSEVNDKLIKYFYEIFKNENKLDQISPILLAEEKAIDIKSRKFNFNDEFETKVNDKNFSKFKSSNYEKNTMEDSNINKNKDNSMHVNENNFFTNEEPRSFLEDTFEIIKSSKSNPQIAEPLSNSSVKELHVNSSYVTPNSPEFG